MKLFRRLLALFLVVFVLVILFARIQISPKREDFPLPSPAPVSTVTLSSFSFAVISDIHSDYVSLQKAVAKVRDDGVEFIIVAGDLTTLGKREELARVRDTLAQGGVFYYVIPGNHDLWSKTGRTNPFREVFGPDYQAFQKDKIKFILINNGDGREGVGEQQENWLKQELADCPQLYCLVFAHMPLNNSVSKHIMGEDSPVAASQAARLVKELIGAKVKELFAGHIHYLSSYELDGLKTTTDGAIFTNKGTQPGRFLEVTVHLPEIKLEKKEVWME